MTNAHAIYIFDFRIQTQMVHLPKMKETIQPKYMLFQDPVVSNLFLNTADDFKYWKTVFFNSCK